MIVRAGDRDGEEDRRTRAGGGFLAHRGLIAVACGAAMAEAGLLAALAPAARGLAPQVTALPPLAIFHDLRWLFSVRRSWLGFSLLLAGVVVGRSALNALLAWLAWPAGRARPAPLAAWRSALAASALGCLLLSPLVSLILGIAILPFSWPFLALVPALLLIAVPLGHAGVAAGWWRSLPAGSAMGWLLAEFTVLSAVAALAASLPPAATVPLAGAAGVVNARAWHGVTAAAAARPAAATGRRRPLLGQLSAVIPPAPLAIATTIALVVVATRLVFIVGGSAQRPSAPVPAVPLAASAARPGTPGAHPRQPGARSGRGATVGRPPAAGQHRPQAAAARPLPGQRAVLEILGFGSSCCSGHPALARALPGTFVQQFSYRGLSRSGRPLPYGPASCDLRLAVLGDRIAAQVWRLYAETHRPVDIAAESEGTLGVDAMLARHPRVPIGSVALLSPILAPGQARYTVTTASGLLAGDELHAVVWFIGDLSPFGSAGAGRFIGSVNRAGAAFADAAARHPPRRLLDIVPLADAVTLPACRLPGSVVVVPAFHGQLLGDPLALQMVRAFFGHRPVRGIRVLRETAEIVAAAASAWRMPERAAPSPPCQP
jgi:hypothetical protein